MSAMTDMDALLRDDDLELAYWQFDARRKGYRDWKGAPQSERDAFKAELRARITAALADDGWVKCSESLPELHKDYWIRIDGGNFATIARLNLDFNNEKYWCLENGNNDNDCRYEDVTHYAEVNRPPLPKEE